MEDHTPGAEVGETLMKAAGAGATGRRVRADQGVGAGLQGAVRPGVLLFPLGPPVLKPDLHLRFCQTQRQRQVQSLAHGQVASGAELVLQGH